jgi:hypothetical protein
MELLVNKADFTGANLVKFSQNIGDDQLTPYIYAAQDYDLRPRLGEGLYGDLEKVKAGTATRPELLSFLNVKVARFLVLAAYRRFIAGHGLNVTQFGLTKTADPQGTFNQAEAAERGAILRQIDADANVALLRMTSTPYTFDGTSYAKEGKSGAPSASIRAPKRKRLSASLIYTTSTYAELLS